MNNINLGVFFLKNPNTLKFKLHEIIWQKIDKLVNKLKLVLFQGKRPLKSVLFILTKVGIIVRKLTKNCIIPLRSENKNNKFLARTK